MRSNLSSRSTSESKEYSQVLLASNLSGKAHGQLLQLSCLLTECCNVCQCGGTQRVMFRLWDWVGEIPHRDVIIHCRTVVSASVLSEPLLDAFNSSPFAACSCSLVFIKGSCAILPCCGSLTHPNTFSSRGTKGVTMLHVCCIWQGLSNASFSRCYRGLFSRGCSASIPTGLLTGCLG